MRKYRAWVRKQYLAFLTKGMLWLRHESLAVQVPALRTLMHFVCCDGDINGQTDQPSFGIFLALKPSHRQLSYLVSPAIQQMATALTQAPVVWLS